MSNANIKSRRIFPIAQLRLVLLITTAAVLCFTFTCLMIVIFQWYVSACIVTDISDASISVPVHTFWDVQDRIFAHCVNFDNLFLISGAVNCFLDVFIVAMPLPLLWRLRTTNSQKLVLTSIFAVAGLSVWESTRIFILLTQNVVSASSVLFDWLSYHA